MSKTSKIFLFFLLLSGSTTVIGQNNSMRWKDYSYIKQSQGWITSENAVGLKALPLTNISMVTLSFQKGNGKLIDYYQSDNYYNIGANIESYHRLTPKIVLFGKIGYDHFQGKNMTGSAFINPSFTPFDIIDYDEGTEGTKKKENYHLVGAISADIYKGFILGGKIDFTAANYAKDKDLRHKNILSDMRISVGVNYKLNRFFDLGANYYYQRRNESVTFNTYGTSERLYNSLISYGAFIGKIASFEGTQGYTTESKGNPLFDEYHGASIQIHSELNSNITLFNEFSYKKREGYYGKKATSSIVYSEHNGTISSYKGKLNFQQKKNLHTLDFQIEHEELENLENVYKIEKPQGEASSIVTYYDPLKVGDKEFFNLQVEYTANIHIQDFTPLWVMKAGFNYYRRKQTASIYPFYREQTINQTSFHLSGSRNFIKGKDLYSISLGLNYSQGSGTPSEDGYYSQPSESQTPPAHLDESLYKEYEFLTSSGILGDVGFKYARLFPKLKIQGYTSIHYSLSKAFSIKHLEGDSFNHLQVAIGCTF